MKSIGEIMKEMGFNPNSSIETQKSFFKHLFKDANLNNPEQIVISETGKSSEPVQLSFDLGDSKKVS